LLVFHQDRVCLCFILPLAFFSNNQPFIFIRKAARGPSNPDYYLGNVCADAFAINLRDQGLTSVLKRIS